MSCCRDGARLPANQYGNNVTWLSVARRRFSPGGPDDLTVGLTRPRAFHIHVVESLNLSIHTYIYTYICAVSVWAPCEAAVHMGPYFSLSVARGTPPFFKNIIIIMNAYPCTEII